MSNEVMFLKIPYVFITHATMLMCVLVDSNKVEKVGKSSWRRLIQASLF
jgi:hypothetical protein